MRRRVGAVGGVAAALIAGALILGTRPGASTANVDGYAYSGTEVFADLGVCVRYSLSGSLHYDDTSMRRLPPVVSHRISTVSLTDPTLALSAVVYDHGLSACTTRAVSWRSLAARQVWTGPDVRDELTSSSYGPAASATQYNSGVTPQFGSRFYTNLTRGRPPCYRVAVDLRVSVATADSARRTPAQSICLTPDGSRE